MIAQLGNLLLGWRVSMVMSTDAATISVITSEAQDANALPDDPVVLKRMIQELLATLKDTRQKLDGVRHRLDLLLKRLYGPKAERFNPNQPTLFEGIEKPPPEALAVVEPKPTPPVAPAAQRKGHGRKRYPDNLQRKRIEYDLSDVEKVCPCCHSQRVRFGEYSSEQLKYEPPTLFIAEHVRFK